MPEPLEVELQTYKRHEAALFQKDEGRYVLVQGDNLCGVWDTYHDALQAGYDKFGTCTPFMVKHITRVVRTMFIDLVPTCRS